MRRKRFAATRVCEGSAPLEGLGRGETTTMTISYLQPEIIARARALGLKARGIVEGLRVGDHRSPFRGFSVEFVQHREYVPGDDVRHIDWKSYGRSNRYTIKQYEQETNF